MRITTLSYTFGIMLSVTAMQTALADAAVDFTELTSTRLTKTVQRAPQLIELTGATTSSKGCLGYDAARLHERAAPFHDTIMLYANRYGVDHNLIKSVIAVESCYNVTALSPKSAQGLMQLIPATAERFGISDPNDSAQNIRGGARYLAWLIARFKGDVSKALAGYNAGEGAVDRYGGIPPYRETQNYVINVLGLYQRLSNKATPTVMASATQALQQDLEGVSTELTAVLRGNNALPSLADSSAEIEQAAARSAALAARPTSSHPLLQRNLAPSVPPVAKQRTNGSNIIPVAAHNTFNPTRVDAANELAARVIDGLIQGGPPIRHGQAAQAQRAPNSAFNPAQANQRRPANPNLTRAPVQAAKRVNTPTRVNTPPKRVSHTYVTALTKPGRGGWEANRARAPGLYKQ
ncbi:MAG: lytic transglycosylase domain-containing protein [Thiofilum sp.]|uniref:lytic transglycosylase domain-containing protein n=1 Tax=Thiofilum sp. TaxID=2212733 RepID=UPI0025D9430F|nr:lytic transglycosylase domain-containing protein [Thiofilum sp.]MBK8451838.1 lytic transglycosylase domain-containing protein [Thiofilum sp.]